MPWEDATQSVTKCSFVTVTVFVTVCSRECEWGNSEETSEL